MDWTESMIREIGKFVFPLTVEHPIRCIFQFHPDPMCLLDLCVVHSFNFYPLTHALQFDTTFFFPSLRVHLTQLPHEFSKITFGPIRNILFEPDFVFHLVCRLYPLQMLRFPVEAHKSADEQVGAIFGGFFQRLAEELGVANGTVEHAVEDV